MCIVSQCDCVGGLPACCHPALRLAHHRGYYSSQAKALVHCLNVQMGLYAGIEMDLLHAKYGGAVSCLIGLQCGVSIIMQIITSEHEPIKFLLAF